MVTASDGDEPATKGDLRALEERLDRKIDEKLEQKLQKYATKEDLLPLATKEELRELGTTLRTEMREMEARLETLVRDSIVASEGRLVKRMDNIVKDIAAYVAAAARSNAEEILTKRSSS
jgi:hypothetical protein